MKATKLILFLILIAIFFYFFCIMVVSFCTAINVIRPPSDICSNAVWLCKVYYDVRRGAIATFILTATGMLLTFIILIIALYIDRCYK
mgnify:CR=1 FL=1